nr:hypothetical protein [Tanacetum cinerariifolium]
MIVILKKSEHDVDFHQIVDFVEASHIRYVLTINPTVYVSHIRQFWSTARIETTNEGTKILVTVDGKLRTISESSIRRNLKLNDEEGISSLPDAELFENLALIGYNILPNQNFTFQKGFNEFSSNIATAVGCLATNRVYNFSKMIFDGMAQQSPHNDSSSSSHPTATTETIPTSTPTEIPTLRQYSRRDTWIAQSKALPTAADEPASLLRDDSQGEAFPTVSGLESSMQQQLQKLTDLCTLLQTQQTEMATKIAAQDLEISRLKERIKLLEDKDKGTAELTGDYAPIKGRSLEIEEEAGVERSTERGSNDTEELVNVLTSMDAVNILTSGVLAVSVPPAAEVSIVGVPTGSGLVPTVSAIFTTASVVTPYSRRKGKEKMVESDTPKKKKLQEQIDVQMAREMEEQMAREDQRMDEQIVRDAEIARIHAEEELQMLIDGLDKNNEVIAKHLHEYEQSAADLTIGEKIELINELVKYQDHHAKILKYQAQQSKPLSKKEQRNFICQSSEATLDGKPNISEMDREDLNQLWTLVKETISIRRASSDKEKELWAELKRLYEPDFEDQLWTHTQALMHDPLEWKLYDIFGVHYVFTRDQEIFMLVERDYPLRRGLAIQTVQDKEMIEASSPDKAFDSGNLIEDEVSSLREDCWE